MSRSPAAPEHCAEAALGLALLFIWMKTWQSVFALRLRDLRDRVPPRPWTAGRVAKLATVQASFHATGLFVMPAAALLTLPFGWTYAFYQALTALGDGDGCRFREVAGRARAQAVLWPRQNHVVLSVLAACALFAVLNLFMAIIAGPTLLKMLLGIETAFTRSMWSFFNTTVLAVIFGLAYLCLDPLVKAAYALRLFYGEAFCSGEDLLIDLRLQRPGRSVAAGVLLAGLLLPVPGGLDSASARSETEDAADLAEAPRTDPAELDRAISRVLGRREFAWRMPREENDQPENRGILAAFLEEVWRIIGQGLEQVWEWIGAFFDWFRGLFPKPEAAAKTRGSPPRGWVRGLLIALLLLAVAGLIAAVVKRRKQPPTVVAEARSNPPAPDLADEGVAADELPSAGWNNLARELWEQGEPRLALRALYLGSLAHLAEQGMLSIARHKSNRDYQFELARRAHAVPGVTEAFGQNVLLFERVWYGMHAVTRELTDRFSVNQKRIMALGE
jgi:hypothetical protein